MSCVMVFVITYMLILPAITIDRDELRAFLEQHLTAEETANLLAESMTEEELAQFVGERVNGGAGKDEAETADGTGSDNLEDGAENTDAQISLYLFTKSSQSS